jgi:hypothetical protein
MANMIFVLSLGVLFGVIFYWGFRALPAERWQILASLPRTKQSSGEWQGLNLTFYGFFVATASALAVATVIVLTASEGISLPATAIASLALVNSRSLDWRVCCFISRLVGRLHLSCRWS